MNESSAITWPAIGRILLKAAGLFVLLNGLFAVLQPLPTLGRLSLYNHLWLGRQRLPYGENLADSYNLSLNNIPAMFASHEISQPKAAAEFRVILIGDSGLWGWFLENEDTLAAQLNELEIQLTDGRQLVFYNLGYPIMSVSKDLLLLEEAMKHEPDLIIWPVTLESFIWDKQVEHPILQNNPTQIRHLIETYHLMIDPADPRFVDPSFLENTIVGQRRALADLWRLQQVGLAWSATGVDQVIPANIPLRQSDFDADTRWHTFTEPTSLSGADMAFAVLAAGGDVAGDVPMLIINEPIFISDGRNSDIRYNAWYPRWAYDQYRTQLTAAAAANQWAYVDLWDTISSDEFTDSPVHLTPTGTGQLATTMRTHILTLFKEGHINE